MNPSEAAHPTTDPWKGPPCRPVAASELAHTDRERREVPEDLLRVRRGAEAQLLGLELGVDLLPVELREQTLSCRSRPRRRGARMERLTLLAHAPGG